MIAGFITVLIIGLLTFSQVAAILGANRQISALRTRVNQSELKLAELEHALARVDRTLKEAEFLAKKGGPFKPYRVMSGALDLHAEGRTATVKATFRPETYA